MKGALEGSPDDQEIFSLRSKQNWNGLTLASSLLTTDGIKCNKILSMRSKEEIVFFYINERNFTKFKEAFEKCEMDIESKDVEGNSPLNRAALLDDYDIVKYLISVGANVNTCNVRNLTITIQNKLNTPLHYALINRNYKISNLLIRSSANQNCKNEQGLNPWEYQSYYSTNI